MCLLFITIGDKDHPTVICNNRDEYYVRRTKRGEMFFNEAIQDYVYSPLDEELKGSWICVSRLIDESNELRFAIVLNFHSWREEMNGDGVKQDFSTLLSRGSLVKNFMEGNQSASSFAKEIFASRDKYRPFNLIVSNGSEDSFYISSSVKASAPLRLYSGVLYGITNGYIDDPWQKVKVCHDSLAQLLNPWILHEVYEELILSRPLKDFLVEKDTSLNALTPRLRTLLELVLKAMHNDEPLEDITFGNASLPVMQLAAVWCKPTIIEKLILHKENSASNRWPEHALSQYHFIERQDQFESKLDKIFGSRTTTLVFHWNSDYIRKRATEEDNPDSSGRFYILEYDADVHGKGSTNTFHNVT